MEAGSGGRSGGRGRRRDLGLLLLLSLLLGLGWLRNDLLRTTLPRLLPGREARTLPLVLLAVAAGSAALVRRDRWPRGKRLLWALAIGPGLFLVPAWLARSATSISAVSGFAVGALVPVFVVLFEPWVGGREEYRKGAFLASLVAVGGALLAVPISVPGELGGVKDYLLLVAGMAVMGVTNCVAARELFAAGGEGGSAAAPVAAIAGAVCAAGFAVADGDAGRWVVGWSLVWPELAWSAVVELPALLLLFYLFQRMSAVRLSARYVLSLWIPLVVVAVATRAALGVGSWIGLGLMGLGGLMLTFGGEEEPVRLSLLE